MTSFSGAKYSAYISTMDSSSLSFTEINNSVRDLRIFFIIYLKHESHIRYLFKSAFLMQGQDQLKEFFSKSGYINRPHRSRLTARNLEATTLLSGLNAAFVHKKACFGPKCDHDVNQIKPVSLTVKILYRLKIEN
ncbi:hypothetical protein BpHYR1_029217 [Brachionus plicatilis]|uniref:Uncharacterized protein n=1 Tax=Brachionus plicatilis TaxID=10195 RepID=A0A3M7S4I3_BRAPC|nr:hypothetical protein BpHYR1_029217 [Brachionus plicatilis]